MASAARDGSPLRLAVVGISPGETCGVRDHATLLAGEMERDHVACELHWLTRRERGLRGARGEIAAWARRLAGELRAQPPQAVLLHYSVFAYSYKGLPLFVRPMVAAVRAPGRPTILFAHELAYPWGPGGTRGRVWSLAQRAALPGLMRACAEVIVTADFRADWLAAQRYLPHREPVVAPVFSTLPPPAPARAGAREVPLVGIFGYSYEGAARTLVLDALAQLSARGVRARLQLLGAPGPDSAAGREWSTAARERGLGEQLSFSGLLPAQELSDALAACDVLVFADASGPSSRKTTLAASLASGAPVVALAGPRGWDRVSRREAAAVVDPSASALREALAALLADERARRALGARGRAFAEHEMSVQSGARAVERLLERQLSARAA